MWIFNFLRQKLLREILKLQSDASIMEAIVSIKSKHPVGGSNHQVHNKINLLSWYKPSLMVIDKKELLTKMQGSMPCSTFMYKNCWTWDTYCELAFKFKNWSHGAKIDVRVIQLIKVLKKLMLWMPAKSPNYLCWANAYVLYSLLALSHTHANWGNFCMQDAEIYYIKFPQILGGWLPNHL